MRIHLGHHFYGAGNLGDDFMLAGFLRAMETAAPGASFTCSVPFPLEPLRQRFPAIDWLPYDEHALAVAIKGCDLWLGLGGSPFQSAQSRWFIDHLAADAGFCDRAAKPMYFLGVGVQTTTELSAPGVADICRRAAAIWTRDPQSAEFLRAVADAPPIEVGADLAHVFLREQSPPGPAAGRLTLVPNFDFGGWPGQQAFLAAARAFNATDRVWLAQESRDLPGAEIALYRSLPPDEQRRWSLINPEVPAAPLADVMRRWPTGEWLVTARYHAALAAAWSGSKVLVLPINEKLRAAAREIGAPLLDLDADAATALQAMRSAPSVARPVALADRAMAACVSLVRSVVAQAP